MSKRRKEISSTALEDQLSHLHQAQQLLTPVVGDDALAPAWKVLDSAAQRRSLSSNHTVVGLFGATGSGKSALFNALCGEELARSSPLRPTTTATRAAIWEESGSAALLDWLAVEQRHLRPAETGPGAGLILLDLPDFDSIQAEHRSIVSRLVGQVDVLVWVLDPQKYADAAVHQEFLAPLASHEAVTLVVLNQVDRLAETAVQPVLDSLTQLLADEGLTRVPVLACSAQTGAGVQDLAEEIFAVARRHQAATERLAADTQKIAHQLQDDYAGERPLKVPAAAENELLETLYRVSRGEEIAAAAATSYRMSATAHTGWSLTRWLVKLRPDPLRRMRLKPGSHHRHSTSGATPVEVDPQLHRSSLRGYSVAQESQLHLALSRFVQQTTEGAPADWQNYIHQELNQRNQGLEEAADQALSATDFGLPRHRWWWGIFGLIQWLALAAAVSGLGILLCYALAGFFQFRLPDPPEVQGFPLATVLLAFGLLLGLLAAGVAKIAVGVAASRLRRRISNRLRKNLRQALRTTLIGPAETLIGKYNDCLHHLRQAATGARR